MAGSSLNRRVWAVLAAAAVVWLCAVEGSHDHADHRDHHDCPICQAVHHRTTAVVVPPATVLQAPAAPSTAMPADVPEDVEDPWQAVPRLRGPPSFSLV